MVTTRIGCQPINRSLWNYIQRTGKWKQTGTLSLIDYSFYYYHSVDGWLQIWNSEYHFTGVLFLIVPLFHSQINNGRSQCLHQKLLDPLVLMVICMFSLDPTVVHLSSRYTSWCLNCICGASKPFNQRSLKTHSLIVAHT